MSCNQTINDIESLAQNTTSNIVTISNNSYDVRHNAHITPSDESMKIFVGELLEKIKSAPKLTRDILDNFCKKLKQKYRIAPSKPDIRRIYETFFSHVPIHPIFKLWMIKKSMRSTSGVLVATIVLSPHKFSCKYDCLYCPQETDRNVVATQPLSYLST